MLLGDWCVSNVRKGLTKVALREGKVVTACSDARLSVWLRSSELDWDALRWEVSDLRQLSCPTVLASSLFTCSELSSSLELQDTQNENEKQSSKGVNVQRICTYSRTVLMRLWCEFPKW